MAGPSWPRPSLPPGAWVSFPGFGGAELRCHRNITVHLLQAICYSPLLVLKGICHYWKYIVFVFVRGYKQIEM